jgi:hypothetical protein
MARRKLEPPVTNQDQPVTLRFDGRPEQILPDQPWTMVRLLEESVNLFRTKASVRVYVTVGSETFRTSIMPLGDGSHFLMFNKLMQKAAAKIGWRAGESVELVLMSDTDERPETPMPRELENALDADPAAKALFEKLAPSHRREYINHIDAAKQESTRQRRALKTIESLLKKQKPDF